MRKHGKVRRLLASYRNIMFHGKMPDIIVSWCVIIALIALIAIGCYDASPMAYKHVDTSMIVQQIGEKNVNDMHMNYSDGSVEGTFKHTVNDVKNFSGTLPTRSDEFVKLYLQDTSIIYDYTKPNAIVETLSTILATLVPMAIVLGGFYYLMGDELVGNVKDKDSKEFKGNIEHVTFDDVCGAPEALEEVRELVTFIKDRKEYDEAGAKTPRGVLLQGGAGTGKTLLARALAGEAGVPFYSASGSDFIEMYVGVGASRIRKLFDTARENQPSIIFIDEIDAIGGNRDIGSANGSTDEHLQTMNQLLTEMDGFDTDDQVIVMAATNRGDSLDPALLRPGRFDRIITVDSPTKQGRKEILEHYAVGHPFAERIDFDRLASRTYGFSGAQLESVMNQAATLAARNAIDNGGTPAITNDDLEEGIARVISGPAMKSRVMSDEEKRHVAYHEAGHAVVQYLLPDCDNVQKISLISRNVPSVGAAMGYVQTYSEDDRYIFTADKCRDEIAALLGGRCAERMFCHIETTGASNDFEKASAIAYHMVRDYGFDTEDDNSAMLRTTVKEHGIELSGQKRLDEIDRRAEDIMRKQYERTWNILASHKDAVEKLVTVLLDREQIDGDEIGELIDGEE